MGELSLRSEALANYFGPPDLFDFELSQARLSK
jgi:hypothetical protein